MNTWKLSKGLIAKIAVVTLVVMLVVGVFILKKIQAVALPVVEETKTGTNEIGKSSLSIVETSLHVLAPLDFTALLASELPVIIDFGADSCIPCKEMAPVLAELNESLKGKAIVRFVDVWKYPDLAEGVPLQVIPTQIFIDASGKPFTPPKSLDILFTLYRSKESNEHVFTVHEGGLTKAQMLVILEEMGMKK